MSVKVVRMQNGEDVIAAVKEMRQSEDGPAMAYKLEYPYALTIKPNATLLLEQEQSLDLDEIDIEFQTYVPLSKHSYIFLPIPSVALIYEPHDNLLSKYHELLEANAETDTTEDQPPVTPVGTAD